MINLNLTNPLVGVAYVYSVPTVSMELVLALVSTTGAKLSKECAIDNPLELLVSPVIPCPVVLRYMGKFKITDVELIKLGQNDESNKGAEY